MLSLAQTITHSLTHSHNHTQSKEKLEFYSSAAQIHEGRVVLNFKPEKREAACRKISLF